MLTSIQRFFLLTVGLLFCILGCTRDHALIPDHISPPPEVHEPIDAEMSFEQNVLPILAARCALAGCHVDGGPNTHGIDFTTYEYFLAGGEHGPVFIPGNAAESEIVEEVVEGKMPPPESGLPRVPDAEIQVFVDWINQQESHDDIAGHDDDMDEDHDAHDEDQDMDDTHDDEADDLHDMDEDHDDDDDDNGHDDDNHDDDN